jgi:hypothetical protein
VENSVWQPVWYHLSHPNPSLILIAGTLHCIIGVIAAIVAKQKGYEFRVWLPMGLIAGTPALIAAWRLGPKPIGD